MRVYYNTKGIGDVLLIELGSTTNEVTTERFGDVTLVTDVETNEAMACNLFSFSTYEKLPSEGPIELTADLVTKLQQILDQNDVPLELKADFTPKFVIGFVKDLQPHPDADKLRVATVDVGESDLQIVCGAPNIEQGQHVVVAKVGATMPSGLEIKDAVLRGVPSSGMICSAKELALPNAPEEKGILVVDSSYSPGTSLDAISIEL
ncbi:YtpR family tRNA-binding protein [Chryseomicrobium sp. FSL W7-1435]|uniref:YtpR family tRNA-binding protein n=1 Tax=Chryseomicrobium sp. FSL W7-1435 TaxID=2921704 RepID=UPI003159B6B4